MVERGGNCCLRASTVGLSLFAGAQSASHSSITRIWIGGAASVAKQPERDIDNLERMRNWEENIFVIRISDLWMGYKLSARTGATENSFDGYLRLHLRL